MVLQRIFSYNLKFSSKIFLGQMSFPNLRRHMLWCVMAFMGFRGRSWSSPSRRPSKRRSRYCLSGLFPFCSFQGTKKIPFLGRRSIGSDNWSRRLRSNLGSANRTQYYDTRRLIGSNHKRWASVWGTLLSSGSTLKNRVVIPGLR